MTSNGSESVGQLTTEVMQSMINILGLNEVVLALDIVISQEDVKSLSNQFFADAKRFRDVTPKTEELRRSACR